MFIGQDKNLTVGTLGPDLGLNHWGKNYQNQEQSSGPKKTVSGNGNGTGTVVQCKENYATM